MTDKPSVTVSQFVMTIVYLFGCPALLLAIAGDWRWIYGWIFALWFVAFWAGCMLWLYRKDPALLAERYRSNGTGAQERWDRFVVHGLELLIWAWLIAMPLDAKRFHWTPEWPLWARFAGASGMLLSSFLLFRSMSDNTFLSPLVRLQAERGHKVVSSGVYGVVRHPMYLGGIVLFYAVPLLLGSSVGLVIAALATLLLVVRILGEERVLVRDLQGYAQYRQRVRYRLLPAIW